MDTICINCPMGCSLHVIEVDGVVQVVGNSCPRGQKYGIEEYKCPKRTIMTLINLDNGSVASCKTTEPVPKDRMFEVLKYIGTLVAPSSVKIGDVVEKNILDLGVDLVITGVK